MFDKLKNIDTAFRYVRVVSMLSIAGAVFLSCYALAKSFQLVSSAEQRIYVLEGGRAIAAAAEGRKENIPVEARDHVKAFHLDFFTLDPDEKVITENISRAFYLADGSAKRQYDNLKESGYYINLITGNISQRIEVDSVDIDATTYPYHFKYIGREKLIRSTSILTRSIITEGWLRNVERSDNNPHGLLIERWVILENKDLKTENR